MSGYGEGTSDPALNGQPTPDGSEYVYDPVNSSKGTHCYPYSAYVWLYDADDLLAVKLGTKNPWDPVPYASGQLALPYDSGENFLNGAAYDPASGRIYLAQANTETANYASRPVIHAFTMIGNPGTGTTGTTSTTGTTGSSSTSGSGNAAGSSVTGSGATGGGGSGCGLGGALGVMLAGALAGLAGSQRRRRPCA